MTDQPAFTIPCRVRTTEPLGVRRRVAGAFELDFLPAGSVCELVAPDDQPGTWVLVDAAGDEVWAVSAVQFTVDD